MRLSRRTWVGMMAAAALAAPAAHAHRSQSVLTTIEWNAANRSLEVIHRLHAQDVEVALAQTSSQATIDLTQLQDQARLIVYVEARFKLLAGKTPIALESIGMELSGEDAVVYREAKLPAPLDDISVDDQLLRDVFEQQVNLVNVRMSEGRVRTLIFGGRDGVKQARGLL